MTHPRYQQLESSGGSDSMIFAALEALSDNGPAAKEPAHQPKGGGLQQAMARHGMDPLAGPDPYHRG